MKAYALLMILTICLCLAEERCYGGTKGFKKVDEGKCSPLTREDVQKLPLEYGKYVGFLKKCSLKVKDSDTAWKTALVSVWAHDYLSSKGTSNWEEFPPPLLTDSNFKKLGTLPELFPMDWVTHLVVSYGKWRNGRPSEIRVDVSNPAVSGDYYYPPLQWNQAAGGYEMKSRQPLPGKRHE